jgi:hypothetical protein
MERKVPRIGRRLQRDGSSHPSPCHGHARLLSKACALLGSSRISALMRPPESRCWIGPIVGSPVVELGFGQLSRGSAHAHTFAGYPNNPLPAWGTYDN